MNIMSVSFERKDIYKGTITPDGKTYNQLDHVLTEKQLNHAEEQRQRVTTLWLR